MIQAPHHVPFSTSCRGELDKQLNASSRLDSKPGSLPIINQWGSYMYLPNQPYLSIFDTDLTRCFFFLQFLSKVSRESCYITAIPSYMATYNLHVQYSLWYKISGLWNESNIRCHSNSDMPPFRYPHARFCSPVPHILRIYGLPNGIPLGILAPPISRSANQIAVLHLLTPERTKWLYIKARLAENHAVSSSHQPQGALQLGGQPSTPRIALVSLATKGVASETR
jgi:hypothetical protein